MPTNPVAPVLDLEPLGAESPELQRTASRGSAAAAADICRRNRYGVFPEHPPPARPLRPKAAVRPLATQVTPEVPVQTATSQATTPPQKSHTTKTTEPAVTTGPEEYSHVAHH
jgi:hypothetical protein